MMNHGVVLLSLAGVCVSAIGQTAPLRFDHVELQVDSGLIAPSKAGGLVYSEEIDAAGADWVRVWFGETTIPAGAMLIVTAPASGHQQVLTAETLAQWSNSSAYFLGDRVFLDLHVPAGAGESRVVVRGVDAGLPPLDPRTICGTVDDRVLSNDPRAARLAPQGCTAWLFNNRPNSAGTAAHCGAAGGDALWFNVPLRTSTGGVVPPPPEHQYPVDGSSVQSVGGWSIGNDWSVFGVFNNSNTGLSPVDAQKASYVLATAAPSDAGRPITITGYGSTTSPVPSSWYAVQKTHTGPFFSESGTTLRYQADTTGGNSGSAIYDETTSRVIGIHTNGGCGTSSTSSNSGTSIENTGFRTAVMIARGVAAGPVPAVIRPLGALPDRVSPDGSTGVGVEIVADFTGPSPVPDATLHTNDGTGWVATAMNAGFAGDWFASFPASACGEVVRYYFSARGANGQVVNFPPSAPAVAFEAVSTDPWAVVVDEDFESTGGWTVENVGVTAGGWERGVPLASDSRGGPRQDADGSGSCWTTGLGSFVDLNGGPTRLVSPVIDLSAASDPRVDVSLWLNADGTPESIAVEFSDDGGVTWSPAGSTGATPGWSPLSFRVLDSVSLSGQFRARFSVSDSGVNNVVEAGVDAFRVRDIVCPDPSCGLADIAPPLGVLDLADVQGFISAFIAQDPAADLAAPFGVWDLADATSFVTLFSAGCN
jgi:hypothetical protein